MDGTPYVVVVGGGVAGLTAAYDLCRDARVTLLEASPLLGGKLRTEPFAGRSLDVGADAFLARVPGARELCDELGLRTVEPATLDAWLALRGKLRRLPAGTILGVPRSVSQLRGVLGPLERAKAARELGRSRQPLTADASVAEVVGSPRVVETLVDPLLGGVYAGRADRLSVRATVPAVAAAAEKGGSLLKALEPPEPATGPVFLSVEGGLSRLVDALAAPLEDVRLGTRAALVERVGRRWRVTLAGGAALIADAVVVATPAPAAAKLLFPLSPEAAAELAAVEYADLAIVAIATPRATLPAGSGLLDPAGLVKAVTFTTQKWPGPARGTILRASVGRAGEPPPSDDDELVAAVLAGLRSHLALDPPTETRVVRWPAGLPQYAVGHLDRVARIEQALERFPTLALAGAAYRGVGIPACVRDGRRAADRVRGGMMLA